MEAKIIKSAQIFYEETVGTAETYEQSIVSNLAEQRVAEECKMSDPIEQPYLIEKTEEIDVPKFTTTDNLNQSLKLNPEESPSLPQS